MRLNQQSYFLWYLGSLQINFHNLSFLWYSDHLLNYIQVFIHQRQSCTIIWDTIWVYNKLVSVNTRNKWVGIKYFRSNRILYNCRNRKAKINIFWNRFYPVFIKDRRTVYQFSCLVAESNMAEIFKTFFVLFWRFIFEMFGLEWVQCCLVLL